MLGVALLVLNTALSLLHVRRDTVLLNECGRLGDVEDLGSLEEVSLKLAVIKALVINAKSVTLWERKRMSLEEEEEEEIEI